ncbi:MAG: trypsin-like peptidase domain-containing protein [Acetobacteraceae bacterium]|nr:trypsin-like peptidase domain-containing protein [Acetobacteraceae bacterium]
MHRRNITFSVVLSWLAMSLWQTASAVGPAACDTPSVVEKALPAIVNIQTVALTRENGQPTGTKLFVGTGFVIDPSGVIVTNKHVIENGVSVLVTFPDKTTYPAFLMAAASLVDEALLKVNTRKPLPTLTFSNSDKLQIGQPVIAVGNPIGVGTSVSTGSVSAVNRNLMRTPFDDFIQTDASINPGNSGGPLLDCSGNLIGMNTALISNNNVLGSIGLGFAMPSNDVRMVADKLQKPNDVPYWLGWHLQDVDARLGHLFNWPSVEGAIVSGLEAGAPAERAGIVDGDIIVAVNGRTMPDARAIGRATLGLNVGAPVTLAVWHGDALQQVEVRGESWPDFQKLRSEIVPTKEEIAKALSFGFGLHVVALTDADRQKYDIPPRVKGVLIDDVRPQSQADNLGLSIGDVIERCRDKLAVSPEMVTAQMSYNRPDSNDLVAVLVHKKTGGEWLTVWLGSPDSQDFLISGFDSRTSTAAQNAAAAPAGNAGTTSAERR